MIRIDRPVYGGFAAVAIYAAWQIKRNHRIMQRVYHRDKIAHSFPQNFSGKTDPQQSVDYHIAAAEICRGQMIFYIKRDIFRQITDGICGTPGEFLFICGTVNHHRIAGG